MKIKILIPIFLLLTFFSFVNAGEQPLNCVRPTINGSNNTWANQTEICWNVSMTSSGALKNITIYGSSEVPVLNITGNDILIIGNLNATKINASEIYLGNKLVQSEPPAFKLINLSALLSTGIVTDIETDILRVNKQLLVFGNISNVNMTNITVNATIFPAFDNLFGLGTGNNRFAWTNISGTGEFGSLTSPTIRLTNLQDLDGSNFFDNIGSASQALTSIDQTGALAFAPISITYSQISDFVQGWFDSWANERINYINKTTFGNATIVRDENLNANVTVSNALTDNKIINNRTKLRTNETFFNITINGFFNASLGNATFPYTAIDCGAGNVLRVVTFHTNGTLTATCVADTVGSGESTNNSDANLTNLNVLTLNSTLLSLFNKSITNLNNLPYYIQGVDFGLVNLSRLGNLDINTSGSLNVSGQTLLAISSGNVGIGTAGPSQTLHLFANGVTNKPRVRLDRGTEAFSGNFGFEYYAGSTFKAGFFVDQSDTFNIYTATAATIPPISIASGGDLNINGGQLLVIQSTGNVGIGTISPSEKLVVIGKVNISDSLNVTNTVQATTFVGDGSLLTGISAGGTSPLNSSGLNVFLNDSTAKVGIGTTTPNEKLTVVGSVNITQDLNVTGRISWFSGTSFFGSIVHSITAIREWTFPDKSGTIALAGDVLNSSNSFAGDVSGTYKTISVDNTKCTGSSDYLDGTGTCDTLDGLDDFSNANTKFITNNTDFNSTKLYVGLPTSIKPETLSVNGNFSVNQTNNSIGQMTIGDFNSTCAGFRRSPTSPWLLSCEP